MKRFLLAQLSDLHVVARGRTVWDGFDTAVSTRAAVATLAAFDPRPDLVLISGDLTDNGDPAAYRHLASLLEPLADRVVVLSGNHDRVENLRAVLPGAWFPAGETNDYVVEGVPRLICLDTSRPPSDAGMLDPPQIEWLDATLAESDAPTIVGLHHPPFETGIAFMDAIRARPLRSVPSCSDGHTSSVWSAVTRTGWSCGIGPARPSCWPLGSRARLHWISGLVPQARGTSSHPRRCCTSGAKVAGWSRTSFTLARSLRAPSESGAPAAPPPTHLSPFLSRSWSGCRP